MIVDSTALPEQAVRDILASAFQSAGQRCSALRMLYVQKDVEKKMLEMLTGAMDALVVGDPWRSATDVGPVIDDEARGRHPRLSAQRMAGGGPADRQARCPAAAASWRRTSFARRRHRGDGARGLRPGAACRDVRRRRHRPRRRGDQRPRLRPDLRPAHAASTPGSSTSSTASTPATSTSTATRSAPSSARSRSAARGCRAPARRPADPLTCRACNAGRRPPRPPRLRGRWSPPTASPPRSPRRASRPAARPPAPSTCRGRPARATA